METIIIAIVYQNKQWG